MFEYVVTHPTLLRGVECTIGEKRLLCFRVTSYCVLPRVTRLGLVVPGDCGGSHGRRRGRAGPGSSSRSFGTFPVL